MWGVQSALTPGARDQGLGKTRGHLSSTGEEPTRRSCIAGHQREVSGETWWVFISHSLTLSQELQAGVPSAGEEGEKAAANLVSCSN